MEDLANFARLVEAIRPWLAHVVIVGGWAHRLYRFHPLATAQEYQPLRGIRCRRETFSVLEPTG